MTQRMGRAFAEVSKLPPPEQDMFAAWMLDELASERRWAKAFAGSEDVLAQLAEEALAEHRTGGRTLPLNPERL